jgi:hypothetical protein
LTRLPIPRWKAKRQTGSEWFRCWRWVLKTFRFQRSITSKKGAFL